MHESFEPLAILIIKTYKESAKFVPVKIIPS